MRTIDVVIKVYYCTTVMSSVNLCHEPMKILNWTWEERVDSEAKKGWSSTTLERSRMQLNESRGVRCFIIQRETRDLLCRAEIIVPKKLKFEWRLSFKDQKLQVGVLRKPAKLCVQAFVSTTKRWFPSFSNVFGGSLWPSRRWQFSRCGTFYLPQPSFYMLHDANIRVGSGTRNYV